MINCVPACHAPSSAPLTYEDPSATGIGPSAAEPESAHSIRNRAKKGVVQVIARSIALRGIGLIGVVILATQLQPRDFGLVAFGLTFQSVGRFFSDSGIGASLLREPEPPPTRKLEYLLGFQLVVTATCCGLLAGIAAPLGTGGVIAAIMVTSLFFESFMTPGSLVCQHRLEYGPVVVSEFVSNFVFWIAAIAGVAAGFGIWAVAVAAPIGAIVGAITMVVRSGLRVFRPRFSIGEMRGMLRFGMSYQLGQAVLVGRDQGVNILCAAVAGATVLGWWNFAYRLLQTTWLIFRSVQRVTFPAMARLLEAGDNAGPVVQRTLARMTVITAFVLAALVACSPALVPAIFGPEWQPTVDILAPAALGALISGPTYGALVGFLFAKGDALSMARAVGIGALVWFAVIVATLGSVGPIMLGFGLLAGAVVEAFYMVRAARRYAPLSVTRPYLVPILCTVVATLPIYLLARQLDHTLLVAVAAGVVAECLLVGLLLLVPRQQVMDLLHMGGRLARGRRATAPAQR